MRTARAQAVGARPAPASTKPNLDINVAAPDQTEPQGLTPARRSSSVLSPYRHRVLDGHSGPAHYLPLSVLTGRPAKPGGDALAAMGPHCGEIQFHALALLLEPRLAGGLALV